MGQEQGATQADDAKLKNIGGRTIAIEQEYWQL